MPIVTPTPSALTKIKELQQKNSNSKDGLRIAVVGGGCSGLTYKLGFDNEKDLDIVDLFKDVKIIIDEKSALYIAGSTLEYLDGLEGTGFEVKNPNASASCGCGKSFA